MKLRSLSITLLLSAVATAAFSQTPAGAPAGTTGVCKDGTFTSVETKSGACSGHKGIKTWMGPATAVPAADKAGTAASTPPAKAAATTPPAKPSSTGSGPAMAAGGGPDKVWVNSNSKVYHCPGTKYYGKTKQGSYMTEAEATAAGNHADHKKACNK